MEKTSGLIPREQNNMQGGCDAAERIAGGPTLAASLLGFSCRTQILSIMLIAVASLSSYSLCFQTFCGGVKVLCVSLHLIPFCPTLVFHYSVLGGIETTACCPSASYSGSRKETLHLLESSSSTEIS